MIHHRINEFSIAGVSGGVPYALACAYKLDHMVKKCSIVSGFAPIGNDKELTKNMSISNKAGFWMAKRVPRMLSLSLSQIAKSVKKDPEKQMETFIKGFYEKDRRIVNKPEFYQVFLEDMKEAYRQGAKGHSSDLKTLMRPWGFSLEDINTKIYIWQGKEDKNVPIEMGYFFKEVLPDSQAEFLESEGHLLYLDYWEDILQQLIPDERND